MQFTITVEVERIQGKFASRDEIGEALVEAVEGAMLDGLGADGDSEYEMVSVEVGP